VVLARGVLPHDSDLTLLGVDDRVGGEHYNQLAHFSAVVVADLRQAVSEQPVGQDRRDGGCGQERAMRRLLIQRRAGGDGQSTESPSSSLVRQA
jgi:hypothetical protein